MLWSGGLETHRRHAVIDPTLVSILGLLVQTPVEAPNTPVSRVYTLDSFRVEEHGAASKLICKCGRYHALLVATADLEKAHPVAGLYACPICLEELRQARSPSDKIAVWFRQNRYALTPDQHVYLPCTFARLVDATDKTIMRPRRFVFAKFNNVTLSEKDKILTTCGDPDCVNPHHMLRAASPATKVTPAMLADVKTWISKRATNQMIQKLLIEKYNRKFSMRTITNIKRSALA